MHLDPWSAAIDDGVVVIEGTQVAAVGASHEIEVPTGARVVECPGTTITAGFWNGHVHLTERKWSDAAETPEAELNRQFEDFTRYGFTTIFDLASALPNTQVLRMRIESGEIAGPRILTAGEGLVPQGGNAPEIVTATMGWMPVTLPEAGNPAEAERHTRRLLADGADAVKIFASSAPGAGGSIVSEDTLRVVVRLAREANKPVFIHPNTHDDVKRAAAANVDVLAHTVPRALLSLAELALIVEANVALIPTLMLWEHLTRHERASVQARVVEAELAQLRAFREAGGTVLFGTDHGAVDPDPTREYHLMHAAGMGFSETLESLTTGPSRRFDGRRTGTIAPGEPADLVVLDGPASRGPALFSDVRLTIRAGRILYSRG